ncbi:unnamed protein product [Effrenium voratum]|nr:unnamed protein product [Effrenium voratum]
MQALVPEYSESEQIGDYMQIVVNFGFVAMFGATCPSVTALCFLSSLPIKQLLAYKYSFARKRAIPRGAEGIGSWNSILRFVAYAGVTCTCYIVVFVYNIEAADTMRCTFLCFVISEHVLMLLKLAIGKFIGSKTFSQLRAEEMSEEK